MKASNEFQLQFAKDRHANDVQAATNARLLRRSVDASPQSLRRSIGRRIIAIGARVAAEPSIQPARSR
jgi:hypothetical protein